MNQYKEKNHHSVDILFVLALFGVFVISGMLLIILGSGIYRNTVNRMQENNDSRTSYSYLTEKLRRFDSSQNVSIVPYGDTVSLCLKEEVGGKEYCTYIYHDRGYLKELYTSSESSLSPIAGQEIVPCGSFQADMEQDNLLHLSITDEKGETNDLYLCLRSTDAFLKGENNEK